MNDPSNCPICGAGHDGPGDCAPGHPGLARVQVWLRRLDSLLRADAAEARAMLDWLLLVLRFLECDVPAILEVERQWALAEALTEEQADLPATLDDAATWLLTQNEADPAAACRAANAQAARILRALAALRHGRDPQLHLATGEELTEATRAAVQAAIDAGDPAVARFGDLPAGASFRFSGARGQDVAAGVGLHEFVKSSDPPTAAWARDFRCSQCGDGTYNAVAEGRIWTHVCPDELVGRTP
ncbi:MAG: hypothetical protein KKB13_00365 [Chloroflexi bacterium]|nr:hypothetical protein [Chloroflexota bacterium]